MKNVLKIISRFMKTIKDIGTSQKKKDPENFKVSFSNQTLYNQLLMISMTSYQLKTGTLKWVFPTSEATFSMVHQEQERVHSPKLLLLRLNSQSASSIVQIKSLILTLIAC